MPQPKAVLGGVIGVKAEYASHAKARGYGASDATMVIIIVLPIAAPRHDVQFGSSVSVRPPP